MTFKKTCTVHELKFFKSLIPWAKDSKKQFKFMKVNIKHISLNKSDIK